MHTRRVLPRQQIEPPQQYSASACHPVHPQVYPVLVQQLGGRRDASDTKLQRQRGSENVANHGSTISSCTAANAVARVRETHCECFLRWSRVKGGTNMRGLAALYSCIVPAEFQTTLTPTNR